jgi:hypothetical protein
MILPLLRGVMKNKSNLGLSYLTVFVLCMELAACVPSQSDCAQVTEIPQVECAALVALYQNTDGTNWKYNTNWLKTATPCDWIGIECLGGHVTELVLSVNNLSGAIPPEIGDLSNLTYFDLAYNQLTTLPTEIGNLSNLTYFDLAYNQLTALPSEIGNLSNLSDLQLWGNRLTVLPSEIGNLSNLIVLDLAYNQLTTLPPNIRDLSSLHELDLYNNQLAVLLPEIGGLSNLFELDLRDNQLTSLPLEIGNLSNLAELQLDGNPFTGTVPSPITNLDRLTYLSLSPCSGLTSSDPQVIAFLDARSPGWNQCP